ncbi:MAG: shikimate kinase, partial [Pseudomonadota bacterium]
MEPKKSYPRIVLIGYRGSGKSSVGRILSECLTLHFIDTDSLIENRAGIPIKEMVQRGGWPCFRQVEKEVIRILADRDLVVAVGGGAVLDSENRELLRTNSLVFYLAADETTLAKRIATDIKTESQRPSLTGQDITAEIGSVLKEREPIYRGMADHVIDTANRSIDDV